MVNGFLLNPKNSTSPPLPLALSFARDITPASRLILPIPLAGNSEKKSDFTAKFNFPG
jgi:hypothetical protein